MKKGLSLSALIAFVALSLSTSVTAKPLKIGTECTYPPFTYRDANGNVEGFDVDVAREVAKRLDREAVFVCNPFAGSIPALQARKFDILFTAMSVTEERMKTVRFSIPYRSATGSFVGEASSDIKIFNDDGMPNSSSLNGKVVGLQRSSTYDRYVSENFPGAEIRRYDTVNNLVLDLKAGRADVIIASSLSLWSALFENQKDDKYKYISPEIDKPEYFGVGVAAAMRKNDAKLQEQVNEALTSMYADGSFKAINLKYWSFTVLPSAWQ